MFEDDTQPIDTVIPQGPITDAYLNRDVHPDEIPGTKASHAGTSGVGGNFFTTGEAETPHPCEDTWLFH
jgi:hypothetical protein